MYDFQNFGFELINAWQIGLNRILDTYINIAAITLFLSLSFTLWISAAKRTSLTAWLTLFTGQISLVYMLIRFPMIR